MSVMEELNLAGCCGIFCGLCSKYQSKAPSRCIGCRLGEQHSWCSIYRCCVMKKGFTTCAECQEYPCERYSRRGWGADQWSQTAVQNLERIKGTGMKDWLKEQRKRRLLLENLLTNYNEGRSMSFYCLAVALMPSGLIDKAISELKEKLAINQIDNSDIKAKATTLRGIIQGLAREAGIELKLRKKGG
ncbi:MAG: DUF3795 domain-containing protein [Dehalococcoidia bacterium]|nr:DUF3795 domain-containing protein [Dehalococcoidia bacterium]